MAKFKARARAIDMLGRQQIAGIPTAISELFKNAHDAYADTVEVDYFRSEDLFVLRDDGIGMTENDFEQRWLAVGTESKLGLGIGLSPPDKPSDKPIRPMLGEKGIGRLAIAAIGPQVLVLSRAKRKKELHSTVAAFINWAVFESPGLDLDQIEIPVKEFPGGTVPSNTDVLAMVESFRANVLKLSQQIQPELMAKIKGQLDRFDIDPESIDGYLSKIGNITLKRAGHGTQFFILPTSESLVADIDGDSRTDSAPPLIKTLIGFSNTMTASQPVRISTGFRDHNTPDGFQDLIAANEFFTPEEFATADHHFRGRFDEYGQFTGSVTIFGKKPIDHSVPWAEAKGTPTECGPFNINLAYVQGNPKETTLSDEDFARIITKLNKIGGLYVYKDGIRVLPYGDSDYDFLDIEKRRTLSAGFYYFSYRRMFGYIEISAVWNRELVEKAGREGFIANKAYRQFRNILKNFFLQMAADFFRSSGAYADAYFETKEELKRLALVRRERESRVKTERRRFGRHLDRVFARIRAGEPRRETDNLLERVRQSLERLQDETDDASAGLLEIEASAQARLDQIRQEYMIIKPKSTGLTSELRREWEIYRAESSKLETEVFGPANERCEEMVTARAKQIHSPVTPLRRAERVLMDGISRARKRMASETAQTRATLSETQDRVLAVVERNLSRFESAVEGVISELNAQTSATTESSVTAARKTLLVQLEDAAGGGVRALEAVRDQLKSLSISANGGVAPPNLGEVIEALEEENLALRERTESDVELAQLGMAISVISHEFESAIRSIRDDLRRLKNWADRNPVLRDLHKSLRSNFDHLDAYLTLFTPLQRRLYRTKVEIKGGDIARYLRKLFAERLDKAGAKIQPTEAFRNMKVVGYPSTFYPVFVNLVDNSLFWLRDRTGPRVISLDAQAGSFIIADTGPGVPLRDRDVIFERGFTRKPAGRGMGLKISRDVLSKEGYLLSLADSAPGEGAVFKIQPLPKAESRSY